MDKAVCRLLQRDRSCDYGIVIDIETGKITSPRLVRGKIKKDELTVLLNLFQERDKALENGFLIGGESYCVSQHRGDEIFARKKTDGDIEHGKTCPGLICLRTKTLLVICHFRESIDMSSCVVMVGQLRARILKEEEKNSIKEEKELDVTKIAPAVPSRRKKKSKGKKKEEKKEPSELDQKAIQLLKENEFGDQYAVVELSKFTIKTSTGFNISEDEIISIYNLFQNQVKAYSTGFEISGTPYCVNRHLGDEMFASNKQRRREGGVVCVRTKSFLLLTTFKRTSQMSPCVSFMGKLKFQMLIEEKKVGIKHVNLRTVSNFQNIEEETEGETEPEPTQSAPPTNPPPPLLTDFSFSEKKLEGVPKSLGEITKEWLEEKLEFGKILDFSFTDLKVEGFASQIKRVHLNYSNKYNRNPKTMILKMTGKTQMIKTARIFHNTEFRIFDFLDDMNDQNLIPPLFTKMYYKEIDKWYNFVFLMEDLGEIGGEVKQKVNMEEAKRVLKTLVDFQKPFWGIQQEDHPVRKQNQEFLSHLPDDFLWYGLFDCNGRRLEHTRFCDENERKINRKFRETFDAVKKLENEEEMEMLRRLDLKKLFREHLRKIHDPKSPKVIVHGDFRGDNMMFVEENSSKEVKFIDWQLSRIGSPMTDFVSFVNGVDFDEDFEFDELMKYYYECLGDEIQKNVPFEHLVEEYKSLVIATSLFILKTYKKGHVEMLQQVDPKLYKMFMRNKKNFFTFLKKWF